MNPNNASWDERQPTRRRPTEPDDDDALLDGDDDAYYTTRIPARARYVPLAQRDAPPPPQPQQRREVYVVDHRHGSPRRASLPYQQQARLSAPSPQRQHVRQTQDDPAVYQQRVPPQQDEDDEEEGAVSLPRRRPRKHSAFYVGMGMIGMLILWYVGTSLVSWWQVTQNDLHFGRPRTFQCDAFVGHNESAGIPSHFIALNLHGQVEIIEFPGGDSTHAKVYLGPTLAGAAQDLVPVTLSFRDVNGDGKADMVVSIQGSQIVFLNDSGQFRPLKAGEHVHL